MSEPKNTARNGGRFAKGNPGKPKGATSKMTRTAKEAFQLAFDQLGGWEGLAEWAQSKEDNRATFYNLYARLIPTDTNVNVKTVDVEFV